MRRSSRLNPLRRRASLACFVLATLSLGIALAAPAASRTATPLVVTPADRAAADAQFDKAKALFDKNKFTEAQVENDKALKLDPTNINAVLLQASIKSRLAGGPVAPATTSAAATLAAPGKIPLLTSQQVTLVRLMELNPAVDGRLAGKNDPKMLEDFWQNVIVKDTTEVSSRAAHDAFINSANFTNQVWRIRQSRERKYMEQVSLTTDPATFIAYRNNVQTFVLQNCASAECHSDRGQSGNFRLINPATSPEQQYTNFFILAQYANADGKMIDRVNPEKSLLLQYALPWANAAAKHPKVDVRKFSGLADSRIRTVMGWISTLAFPKPNYYIDYNVPGATTAPASKPATATAPKQNP
jgi:hypothetical protein